MDVSLTSECSRYWNSLLGRIDVSSPIYSVLQSSIVYASVHMYEIAIHCVVVKPAYLSYKLLLVKINNQCLYTIIQELS